MQSTVMRMGARRSGPSWGLFKGNWNPERRRMRKTLEYSTLPSFGNRFTMAPGGASEGLAAAAACLSFVLGVVRYVARVSPKRF